MVYIYLHLVDFYGKCRELYQSHGLFGVWNTHTHTCLLNVAKTLQADPPLSGWQKIKCVASDISTIKDHTVHFQFIPKSTTKKRAQGGPCRLVTDGDGEMGMGMDVNVWGQPDLSTNIPCSGKTWTIELQYREHLVLVGGLFQPIYEKYARQIGGHLPRDRGENKKQKKETTTT